MPSDNDFLSEATEILEEPTTLPVPQLSPRFVYRPPPRPEPLLTSDIPLCREAPQPERLTAVLASPTPLIAAAQPLLDVLAALPRHLEAEEVAPFRRRVECEIASFQSVCTDARILLEYIIIASYVLCTAIDDAVGRMSRGAGTDDDIGEWAARPLADRFHGDTQGGSKVFRLLAHLLAFIPHALEPVGLADLIDLIGRVLDLGFQGFYRHTARGERVLEDIRHDIDIRVTALRREIADRLATAQRERERNRPMPADGPDSFSPWPDRLVCAAWCLMEATPAIVLGWFAYRFFA